MFCRVGAEHKSSSTWVVLNPTLNILNTALRDRRVFEVIISLVSSYYFPIEQLLFGWTR